MSGIVFFNTENIENLKNFYLDRIGCDLWMDQEDCIVFKHDNFLFGFCIRDSVDTQGMVSFFYSSKEEVDGMFEEFKEDADNPPELNKKYPVYHFFTNDPDGRTVEFQSFTTNIEDYQTATEILISRRSIRNFTDDPVSQEVLDNIFEVCRFVPTSQNSQPYYFKIITNPKTLNWIAQTRAGNSAPIGKATMAVAVCTNPEVSSRHIQDGCIAAYHFILSAWSYGIGTCWIAAMDREDVKEVLNIPKEHFIATITPIGYPAETPETPERQDKSWFVR